MRLHILSDLHLEFGIFKPQKVNADVIVLAGDIHTGKNGIGWIQRVFPDTPVIYVLGNHEFYGHRIPELTNEIRKAVKGTNVHVLENERIDVRELRFLGATLWTDFNLYGDVVLAEVSAVTNMADFERIRVAQADRPFRPADAKQLHVQSLKWLVEETANAAGKKVVVVTHHAPSPQSIPLRFRNSLLNPAFASDLEAFIRTSGIHTWIHGHIHEPANYMIASTRVLANPRGYVTEAVRGFDAGLIVDI
jgi:predicted phosphodiesterase